MRTSPALLALVLVGCTSLGTAVRRDFPEVRVVPGQTVDAAPRYVACVVAPNQPPAQDAFLLVPVRFTVTPDGSVARGSAQSVGKVDVWARQTGENEVVTRLKAKEDAARLWAQRNAETCTFEPAKLGGQSVAVQVEQTFRWAE